MQNEVKEVNLKILFKRKKNIENLCCEKKYCGEFKRITLKYKESLK